MEGFLDRMSGLHDTLPRTEPIQKQQRDARGELMTEPSELGFEGELWAERLSTAICELLAGHPHTREPALASLVEPMLDKLRASAMYSGATLRTLAHHARVLERLHTELLDADDCELMDTVLDSPAASVLEELRQVATRCRDLDSLEIGEELCQHLIECPRAECGTCSDEDELIVRESFAVVLARAQQEALHAAEVDLATNMLEELMRFEARGPLSTRGSNACVDAVLATLLEGAELPDDLMQRLLNHLRALVLAYAGVYPRFAYALALATRAANTPLAELRWLFAEQLDECRYASSGSEATRSKSQQHFRRPRLKRIDRLANKEANERDPQHSQESI